MKDAHSKSTLASYQFWSGTSWKTVSETALAAGVPIREVEVWIRERKALAVKRDGVALLPAYEFGADGAPLPVIAQVIEIFDGILGEVGVAAFFESPSSFLDGRRPRELVADASPAGCRLRPSSAAACIGTNQCSARNFHR